MGRSRQQSIAKRARLNAPQSVVVPVVKGCLEVKIQSVVFHKDRFITFEKAAQAAEAMGLLFDKREESQTAFIFHQCDAGKFKEMSLQTIELEHGISAVIGVPKEDMAPELPHDANAVSHDKKPAGTIQTVSSPSPEKVEVTVEVEVSPEQEMAAWNEVEETQSLGYVFMSADEITQLKGLKDEFGAQLKSVQKVLGAIVVPVTKFLDSVIDTLGDNVTQVELIDRVNTGLILLDETLSKFEHEVDVQIEKDVIDEITQETQESVCQALKTLSDTLEPVISLFEDTSFERFHTLTKSVDLSTKRIVKEFLDIKKGLMPEKGMSRDELRQSQTMRSEKFGIEVVSGSALTFPANFPTDLADYGDPVNLKFPIESRERAANARVRFKQFANEIYKSEKSKAIVHERIVMRELELGITVSINPNDELDKLLPASIMESGGVQVVDKSEELEASQKVFVPLTKSEGEQRIAFGIVLEPDVTDLHEDTYDEETVEKAAHFFMEEMQNIGVQHTQMVNNKVKILESYIAPTDLKIETPAGLVKIRKNTWLMKVRIVDTEIWNKVKSGDLTGFSIGALANVESLG